MDAFSPQAETMHYYAFYDISDSEQNLDSRMKKCKSAQDIVSECEDFHYIEQEKCPI